MDFGTLKTRVVELLGRNAFELSYELATSDLNDTLRIRGMEKTVTIAASGGDLALPEDFIEAQQVRNVGGSFLTPTSHERMIASAKNGCPTNYVAGDAVFYLNPAPADGHEVKMVYFAKLAPLVNAEDTNAALDHCLQVYVYTALAHHARLIRDNVALPFWDSEAQKAVALANRADLKGRLNGGTLDAVASGSVV